MFCDFALPPDVIGMLCSLIFALSPGVIGRLCSAIGLNIFYLYNFNIII